MVLPLSTSSVNMLKRSDQNPSEESEKSLSKFNQEKANSKLKNIKNQLKDTPAGAIINKAKTLCQANSLMRFVEILTEKNINATVCLTAARGRGKSATLGLSLAASIAFGYSNIFITAPSPENLQTVFEFVKIGLDLLKYQESTDYSFIQSTNEKFNKAIVRVKIFKNHNQIIQYIHPSDYKLLSSCEIMCIDEAAAIPLPFVKRLLGNHLVFMSSTISGYEGTGRSLSLKLIDNLRKNSSSESGKLYEISLLESIRYSPGDPCESWLTNLLCLEANLSKNQLLTAPVPDKCKLFYVNRDTLFSYHLASEKFLQNLMGLFVSSHYKNSPNDLQILSDAPAHQIFVLTPPISETQTKLPEILAVIQVALEGKISKNAISKAKIAGEKPAGDLIPWKINEQFQDENFPLLSGARIVRIAVHPDFQGQGYGSHAVDLLCRYYAGEFSDFAGENSEDVLENNKIDTSIPLEEEIVLPQKNLPPLFIPIEERPAEKLNWIGSSFGLTENLGKFWFKSKFKPVYLSQSKNETTGEYSALVLRDLAATCGSQENHADLWVEKFYVDFKRRFISLLSGEFSSWNTALALQVLVLKIYEKSNKSISKTELDNFFLNYDYKRLNAYTSDLADYPLIMDLLPDIARLYFNNHLSIKLSNNLQKAILCAVGLQRKTLDSLASELNAEPSQIKGLFKRTIKAFSKNFHEINQENFKPEVEEKIGKFLEKEAEILEKRKLSKKENEVIESLEKEFEVKGTEEEWKENLGNGKRKLNGNSTEITIKTIIPEKKSKKVKVTDEEMTGKKNNKNKNNKKRKSKNLLT